MLLLGYSSPFGKWLLIASFGSAGCGRVAEISIKNRIFNRIDRCIILIIHPLSPVKSILSLNQICKLNNINMGETWNKKEREKKKQKNRQDKKEKMQERKEMSKEGKSFDDMIAYVDENGNFSATPPDPRKKVVINVEDIEIGVPKHVPLTEAELTRKGKVTFFNDTKGFGFIKDLESQESVFVHVNELSEAIKENDRVSFEVQMGHKGPNAVNVKLIK